MKVLSNQEFKQLENLIKTNGLEVCSVYGERFIKPVDPIQWSPEVRAEKEKYKDLFSVHVGTMIYQVREKDYSPLLTPEQAKELQILVDKVKASSEYKKSLEDRFNSYTYELTIFSPEFLTMMGQKWYSVYPQNEKLPLNASADRDEALKNLAIEEGERIKKHMITTGKRFDGYRVEKKLLDTHYSSAEFAEMQELCSNEGRGPSNHHPTHQSTRTTREERKHRINDFKPFTFKSTGRKILLWVHEYGFEFIPIDKVVK